MPTSASPSSVPGAGKVPSAPSTRPAVPASRSAHAGRSTHAGRSSHAGQPAHGGQPAHAAPGAGRHVGATAVSVTAAPPAGRHSTGSGQGFGTVVGWTLLGGMLPGLVLLVRGHRRAGWTLAVVTVTAGIGAGVWATSGDAATRGTTAVTNFGEWVAVSPDRLAAAAVTSVAIAAVWAGLVLVTHVVVRRQVPLAPLQRLACSALVLALMAAGITPAVKVADYALVTRQTLESVFGRNPSPGLPGEAHAAQPQAEAADPWADLPRVNVLLIGSDAGADRTGIRPDTMIVASIDTRTGDTVLFSLPRNLQRVPFPAGSAAAAAYPHGFYCVNPANGVNTECLLNAVWSFAEQHAHDYYRGVANPGLTATTEAAQEITGLTINNYAMINLRGFMEFVDAIGGLTLNITQRLPIGGNVENRGGTTSWLEPGRRKLDGYHALWFARSRWSTNDYDRMRRQRCVIGAVTQQADPVTLARNFPAIARAAQQNIQTDIRLDQLDAWVQLTKRVQHASVRSLPFTSDVIDTVHPDFDRVHALVQDALTAPVTSTPGTATATPTPSPTVSTSPHHTRHGSSGSSGASPSGSATAAAQDIRDVC